MNTEVFCELYSSATNIPIAYYSNTEKLIKSFSIIDNELELNVFGHLFHSMKQAKKNPYVSTSDTEGFYGIVQLESSCEYLIMGPVFSIPVSDSKLYDYMHENAIPMSYKDKVAQYLNNIPLLSYQQFLVNIQFLHYSLNGEKINIYDHFNITAPIYEDYIASKHTLQSFDKKQTMDFHNTYIFEQQLLNYVKNGETEKLKDFLHSSVNTLALKEGILADSQFRQAKNIFIGVITIIGKQGAIAGGLDIEETYQLIDIYIQECEKLRSINDVINLQYTMIMDFCERVRRKSIPSGFTKEIYECMHFINMHTNKIIQISDVAKHIGKSVSFISHRFKNELGFSIGTYITRCKLEDAKRLLTYSSKSISEISSYLCFSSQSYFQNVFKNEFGITPNQYRKIRKPPL